MTTEKIAVVAPMPSVSAATAAMVKPGLRSSVRERMLQVFVNLGSPDHFRYDDAAFHDECDFLQDADVRQRVAGNRDDVGEVAGLQRADLPLPAEQLGAVQRAGLKRGQRRHAVLHHQRELAGLRAVGKRPDVGAHRDGNAGGELLREIRGVEFLQLARRARPGSGVAACSMK